MNDACAAGTIGLIVLLTASVLPALVFPTLVLPASAESPTGQALTRYVARHDPGSTCTEHRALGRTFLHCSHGPHCEPPNLLFEIRGGSVILVDGETGAFVDVHADVPAPVSTERPITYSASDVLLALGCPH